MASSLLYLAILAAVVSFLIGFTNGLPARYDQRQEGESNIRTEVQDVVLLIVPPKDFFTAGLGIATASAANLLKKNYFSDALAPEKFNYRPQSKLAYGSPDKAPYKFDLNKPGIGSKKITHHGDPNRYNINDEKVPLKSVTTSKPLEYDFADDDKKVTTEMTSTTNKSVESNKVEKILTGTSLYEENKTVKKDLKAEEMKEMASTSDGNTFSIKVSDVKVDQNKPQQVTKSENADDVPRVIGELSPGELGPTSIFSHEGCGPDAYRDLRGICIYRKNSPK